MARQISVQTYNYVNVPRKTIKANKMRVVFYRLLHSVTCDHNSKQGRRYFTEDLVSMYRICADCNCKVYEEV